MKKNNFKTFMFVMSIFLIAIISMNFKIERINAECVGKCSCMCTNGQQEFNVESSKCSTTCHDFCGGNETPGAYVSHSWAACVSCDAGEYYSSSTGECEECGIGTYSQAGATSCTQCPAGTHNNNPGASSCSTCPANTYSIAGSSTCTSCPDGYHSNSGSTSKNDCRITCSAGYYHDALNGCKPCPKGTFSESDINVGYGTTVNCTPCPDGYTTSSTGADSDGACYKPSAPNPSYTITANANGGTITTTTGWTNASDNKTATKSVTSGSTIGTLPTVTRSGYTLKEWRTKSDGTGDVVTSSTTATASMTIYAIWTENTTTTSYTITANANGGKMEIYGDQTGGADSTTNTAGFILYPNAMPGVEYTITMSSATLTSGSATKFSTRCYDLTSDATLSRKDVSFGSNISYTITCPSTANAEHQLVIPIYYGEAGATAGNHVTFSNIKIAVNTGWTNVSGNLTATKSISSGSTYGTLPIAVRPGYTLKEWNTKSDGTGTKVTSSITATANATIYAIWTKTSPDAPTPPSPTTSYQISFDCNGGTGSMSPMSVNFGQTVTLIANACVRTGYTFTGWAGYIGGTPIDGGTYSDGDSFDYTFESDMILKAQWNSNSGTSGTYLIHYDANGGTGTMADTEATVDVTGSLRANAFKYSGHTFDGWRAYYVDSDGLLVPLKDSSNNEVELKNKASFKNLYGPNGEEVTLYAQWKVKNPNTGIITPTVIIGGLLLVSALGYYLVKKKNMSLN